MAIYKIQTSLRIDPDLLEKLTVVAKEEKRSINSEIEHIIREYVKRFDVKDGIIADE